LWKVCIREGNGLGLVQAPLGQQRLLGGRRVAEPEVAGLLNKRQRRMAHLLKKMSLILIKVNKYAQNPQKAAVKY
jgi:hypothetical protein